jgi:tetratricopeptide (TPR) repeat protein
MFINFEAYYLSGYNIMGGVHLQELPFSTHNDPKGLELRGLELLSSDNVEEGVSLLLQAIKLYESVGAYASVGRVYQFLGEQYLKIGEVKTAEQFLKRGAYYYSLVVEEKASKIRDIRDVRNLDMLASKILLIFTELGDEERVRRYAFEFGKLFETIALENSGMLKTLLLEYAYFYYKLSGEENHIKSLVLTLLDNYEEEIRTAKAKRDYVKMGEYYRKSAHLTLELEGHGDNYISLMKESGRYFENAGKEFYAQGRLDKAGKYLVEAEYSYLLAGDTRRAKLIANNVIKILKQQLVQHKKAGNREIVEDVLMNLTKAYMGVGLVDEALSYYKALIEEFFNLTHRFKIRYYAVLYVIGSSGDKYLKELTALKQLLMRTHDDLQLLEGIQEFAMRIPPLGEIFRKISQVEGIY